VRRLLAVLAALANANFVLAPVVGARVDLTSGVISELSVAGQPGAVWFRLGDGSSGLLCLVLAFLLRRRRFSSVCLALFGLGTFLSAVVPLTCAPSLGPCPASSDPAAFWHDAFSVVATTGAVVGVLELARRTRGVPAIAAALVSAGCGVLGVVDVLTGGNGGGVAQMAQVVAVSVWIVLEALPADEEWPVRDSA
jgi:hypothetical protein